MATWKTLAGKVFGRWTVLRRNGNLGKKVAWLCRCSCGNEANVQTDSLTSGKSKSCGCLHIEKVTKHSRARTNEYMIWTQMKQRCTNKRDAGFHLYGGRGVKVCERWLNSFANFITDIGPRPSKRHSLDRYPNQNGNYEPDNVRWATWADQAANKRNVVFYTHNGTTMHLNGWAKYLGVCRSRLKYRLDRGLSFEQAINPVIIRIRNPATGRMLPMS
jgi:hypothetical protein